MNNVKQYCGSGFRLFLPSFSRQYFHRSKIDIDALKKPSVFFLAGIPALIYQLTWQRTLFRIFGVNIESVTIVVTAFMLGLGIGSLAGGWLSKWSKVKPLAALAIIELATGAFGIVSLAVFDKVEILTTGLSLFATGAVTLALIIAPTLLMGATLPLLVNHLARRLSNWPAPGFVDTRLS